MAPRAAGAPECHGARGFSDSGESGQVHGAGPLSEISLGRVPGRKLPEKEEKKEKKEKCCKNTYKKRKKQMVRKTEEEKKEKKESKNASAEKKTLTPRDRCRKSHSGPPGKGT